MDARALISSAKASSLLGAGIRTAATGQGETRGRGKEASGRNQSAQHAAPVGGASKRTAGQCRGVSLSVGQGAGAAIASVCHDKGIGTATRIRV